MASQSRYFIRSQSGSPKELLLGGKLGDGALGVVYKLLGTEQGYAVKFYKADKQSGKSSHAVASANEAKVDWLIKLGLPLAPNSHGGKQYPQLAWPTEKVYDGNGRFSGFTMPEIDLSNAADLSEILKEPDRKLLRIQNHFHFRIHTARNLAFLFHHLHKSGVCMIDVKPENVKFYRDAGFVCLIDCDSFISTDRNQPHNGAFQTAEYKLPEAANGGDASEYREEQDKFALAVVIFQMLNEGRHPYDGVRPSPTDSDIQKQIDTGLYPYGFVPHPAYLPSPHSRHEWFDNDTRRLFDRAFTRIGQRPTAKEWADHLAEYKPGSVKLLICRNRPNEHVHFSKGCFSCAWEDFILKCKAGQKANWPKPTGSAPVQQAPWTSPSGAPSTSKAKPVALQSRPSAVSPRTSIPTPIKVPWALIFVGLAIVAVLSVAIVSAKKKDTTPASPHPQPSEPVVTPIPEWTAWVAPDKEINVRTGPGLEYPILSTEKSGSPIITTGGVKDTGGNNWQEVRLSSGQRGFIASWVANKSLNSFHPSFLPETVAQDAYASAINEGVAAYGTEYSSSIPDREGSVDPSSRSMNPPNYPPEERRRGIQGTSVLVVSIDASGGVYDVSVDRSTGNRNLDREAVKAARRWRFNPEIRAGQQVASRVRVPVEFRLSGGGQSWGGAVATVACFLPGGNEVRVPRSECRTQGGSVFE